MVYLQIKKTDFEVLAFLIENINEDFSIRELSKKLKRPYVKIHKSIKRLADKKIIIEAIRGKSHYCSINYKDNLDVVCFVNSQRAKAFLERNKKIDLIVSNISALLKFPDYSLVLFGSYAKGSADKNSDLDLAVIASKENKAEAERVMNSIKRLSSLEIHSLEFTYEDFIEMLRSKEGNVGKEIIKKSIIFKGCEQFYNCILGAR